MSVSTTAPARPFVKWAGGKRQLLPEIWKYVPKSFGRYFEPFVGGGAVFFELQPGDSVLSDSNERLIKTYRAIRDDVDGVIALLSKCPYEESFYKEMLALNVDSFNDVRTASWFIYTNKAGYNGLYRVNKSGKFNVPFGNLKNPTICDESNLRACSDALRGVELRHADFADVLKKAKRNDFVYIDPPYIPLNDTSSFTAYQPGGFDMGEQMRLCMVIEDLVDRGVHVLVSGSSAEATRELYGTSRFTVHEVQARRNINSKGDGRGEIAELLIVGRTRRK